MFLFLFLVMVELLFKEKENKNINKFDKKEIVKDFWLNLKKEKNLGKVLIMILYKCIFYFRKKDF